MKLFITAFFALFANIANAGPIADWGGTGCRLDKALSKPYVATVTCHNELTGGVRDNAGAVDLYGLRIGLVVTMGDGRVPDTFQIFPPEGFFAVPPEMTLREGETGVVLIFLIAGMVMG